MKIWINKESDEKPNGSFADAYIFTLSKKGYSTIFTNIADTWLRLGMMAIRPVYEDLFIIAISIFAVDKRVSRRQFADCWTREIDISIPVMEFEKWKLTTESWNTTLNFLTGDIWNFTFRKTEAQYSLRTHKSHVHLDISGCNVVSLFSGGLDSFCGAIRLLESGYSPCLFGHNEYPKLRVKQESLAAMFRDKYPKQTARFLSFTANSRAPVNQEGKLAGAENTSRGRSLLFLCAALTVAGIMGKNTPLFIPENGFIGLNIPLTDSRRGSCSTRTTHPYFLRCFKNILASVGIQNPVNNFFAYKSKREIVNSVKDTAAFKEGFEITISCSHPCVARYNRNGSRNYPINCGYCYPCLVRKSSLLDVNTKNDHYSFAGESFEFLQQYSSTEKCSDLLAVINSIYRYLHAGDDEIRRLIKCTGSLSREEVERFVHVYNSTMQDIIEMFAVDNKMKAYIGL